MNWNSSTDGDASYDDRRQSPVDFARHPKQGDLLDSIKSVQKVENPVTPLSTTLGILGTDGVTLYFGCLM